MNSILITGPQGSGKTEKMRSLVRELSVKAIETSYENFIQNESHFVQQGYYFICIDEGVTDVSQIRFLLNLEKDFDQKFIICSQSISIASNVANEFDFNHIDLSINNRLKDYKTGIAIITAERIRQINEKGFDTEHDIVHYDESLAAAAAVYATPISSRIDLNLKVTLWPPRWHYDSFKPTPNDRMRELAKAGALIAAEIDRLIALGESVQNHKT